MKSTNLKTFSFYKTSNYKIQKLSPKNNNVVLLFFENSQHKQNLKHKFFSSPKQKCKPTDPQRMQFIVKKFKRNSKNL